ncbi:protein preY [Huso huso]|uniref:Protein preY, mitochondrial n=3 Tax=Acipenseridae TaxID=7900 RepID=A0A444UMI3_ACIRT|nr:Protein preY, mitochondrial [Acipenser ruthenus]
MQNVYRKLVLNVIRSRKTSIHSPFVPAVRKLQCSALRLSADGVKGNEQKKGVDASLLEYLVCPLSKKPLRYEALTNELINEELGIAYPIVDGIPNMIPQDARMTRKDEQTRRDNAED